MHVPAHVNSFCDFNPQCPARQFRVLGGGAEEIRDCIQHDQANRTETSDELVADVHA